MKRLLRRRLRADRADRQGLAGGERGAAPPARVPIAEWYRARAPLSSIADDCEALVRVARGRGGRRRRCAGIDRRRSSARPCARSVRRARAASTLAGDETADGAARQGARRGRRRSRAARPRGTTCSSRCSSTASSRTSAAGRPTFVFDWPAPLGALARRKPDDPRLVERFELYAGGLELANAFGELTDPSSSARASSPSPRRARRAARRSTRSTRRCWPRWPRMPPTSGVALGFDRLVMLVLGAERHPRRRRLRRRRGLKPRPRPTPSASSGPRLRSPVPDRLDALEAVGPLRRRRRRGGPRAAPGDSARACARRPAGSLRLPRPRGAGRRRARRRRPPDRRLLALSSMGQRPLVVGGRLLEALERRQRLAAVEVGLGLGRAALRSRPSRPRPPLRSVLRRPACSRKVTVTHGAAEFTPYGTCRISRRSAPILDPDPLLLGVCAAGGLDIVTQSPDRYGAGRARRRQQRLMQIVAAASRSSRVFYLLVIRPQSKKAKEHQKMLTELKKGDEVVTRAGSSDASPASRRRGHAAGAGGRPPARAARVDHRRYGAKAAEKPPKTPRPKTSKPPNLRNANKSWNAPGGGRRLSTGFVTVLAVLYLVRRWRPKRSSRRRVVKKHFQKRIQLGLDLQGGLHLVYEVNVDKAVCEQGRPPRVGHRGPPAQGQGRQRRRRSRARAATTSSSRSRIPPSRPSSTTRC